jgi:bla regulator protein BlaR1
MRSAGTAAAMIIGLCSGIAVAQKFDAASIKRSAPDSESFMKAHPGGRLEISRATLRVLTALAWRLQPFQVSGGPAWVRSEYFNVNTTAAESSSEDHLFLMIRNLLEERFALKTHFETAERPVYILVQGKTGRTSAAGLQVSTEGSCDPDACGSLGMGVNHLEAHGIPMARFAEALSRAVDRKVIDGTGRTENFDISLRWQPDERQALPSSDAIPLPTDTPSIFSAIEEQLGLKLEPEKAAVELLVIDHAERPSGN